LVSAIWRSNSSISITEAVMLARHGSGTSSRLSSFLPSTPNRSVTGQACKTDKIDSMHKTALKNRVHSTLINFGRA
jgi:hypothetical protein